MLTVCVFLLNQVRFYESKASIAAAEAEAAATVSFTIICLI